MNEVCLAVSRKVEGITGEYFCEGRITKVHPQAYDRSTIERINKGLTPEQAEEGMAKAKAAGIEILVSIIFGIGGKKRSREHIVETTRLLNHMEPEQIAPMALAVQPSTILEDQVETGEFIQLRNRMYS